MGVESWSTTAASNNSSPPDGAPEGWAPSSVNNWGRETMASIRSQLEHSEWFNWGDTATYASGTSFTISGDVTSRYTVNRRIWVNGATPGDIYGKITASSYSSPDTTVTISFDSGSMSNEALTVYLSIHDPTNANIGVSNLYDAGTFVNDGDSPNVSTTSFDVDTNLTESSWESIGPTGSGADNTWTALDSLSTDVDWIEIKISVDGDTFSASGDGVDTARLYARGGGGTSGTSLETSIGVAQDYGVSGNGAAGTGISYAKVPVDGDNIFDLHYVSTFEDITAIDIYLVGYGSNP